jgi:hypothetical protein
MGQAPSTTTFVIHSTEYGWAVSTDTQRLGLFLTQQHALTDVNKRRAALAGKGLGSTAPHPARLWR